VARFLSPEWFDDLLAGGPQAGVAAGPEAPGGSPDLVVGVAVTSVAQAPAGEVRYQVAVKGTKAVVLTGPAASQTAQVVLSADYATMTGIASGRISALDAMSSSRARITGNTAALSAHQSVLEALDLVPSLVRASTSF
jgi:alkyl sulfatase BDS1-like metallo-beta-lactamase superfamily hydrolase